MSFHLLPTKRALPALLLLATATSAQVPDGWYVVAGVQNVAATVPGPGGLFLVRSRAPAAPVPVVGLGPDLTGVGLPGPAGANSVLRRPDGALVVGEIGPPGTAIDVHVITLAGAAVATDVTYFVGTATAAAGLHQVAQCALLPSGNIIAGASGLGPPGPIGAAILANINPTTGVVLPVVMAPVPAGTLNALAVNAAGTVIYFGMAAAGISTIYSLPVGGGVAPVMIAPLPTTITGLAVNPAGLLVAACNGGPNLFTVNPVTGAVVPVPSPTTLNGIAVETVTGNYAAAATFLPGTVSWITPAGVPTPLTAGPSGGWGIPSGIAINPNPERYGAGSPGLNWYGWALAPNPGGLPTVGNAGFSLTATSTPGSALGVWILSIAPASVPVLGITLLLDPGTFLVVGGLPPGPAVPIPLPLPADPSLVGASLRAQTFHFEPGLAASDGLWFTVF